MIYGHLTKIKNRLCGHISVLKMSGQLPPLTTSLSGQNQIFHAKVPREKDSL